MPFNSFLNYPMSWKPERSKLKRPIYLSLAEQLEKDIAAGFLLPGTLNAIALTLLALSVLLQSYYNNDLRAQKSRPRRSDRQVRHDTDRGRHPCVLECRHFKRLCRACLPLSAGTIGLYQRYFQTLMFRTACRLSGVRRPFPGTDPQCDLQCK